MLARFAKAVGIPLPLLTGAPLAEAEWSALDAVATEWTFSESLLVVVAERLDAVRFMVQKMVSDKGAPVAEPLRIPRPGERAEAKEEPLVMRASEFASFLAGGGG